MLKQLVTLTGKMTKVRQILLPCNTSKTKCDAINGIKLQDCRGQGDSIHRLDEMNLDVNDLQKVVEEASQCLQNYKIIAVPTDTVYGIAGLAQSSAAVRHIYAIKGRDGGKPISICVSGIEQLYRWGKVTVNKTVLEDLLPGPVTVVFERTPLLNPDLNPGTALVGMRVPDHDFIRQLAASCDGPLALTSANTSKQPSTLSTQEFHHLWPELELVVDGGVLGDTEQSRAGSTVVDLSQEGLYSIIRPGSAMINTRAVLEKHGLKTLENAT